MIIVACSAVLLRNNEVCLIKEIKAVAAGLWGLPGGKLEENESIVECVKREVLEETGLKLEDPQLFKIVNKPKSNEGNTVIKFVFLSNNFSSSGSKNEHEYRFMSFEEVQTLGGNGSIRGKEVVSLIEEAKNSLNNNQSFYNGLIHEE